MRGQRSEYAEASHPAPVRKVIVDYSILHTATPVKGMAQGAGECC